MRKKYSSEFRRNKIDISAGFSNLKEEKRDSYVREFIDKLKEKTQSSTTGSTSKSSDVSEESK